MANRPQKQSKELDYLARRKGDKEMIKTEKEKWKKITKMQRNKKKLLDRD